MDNQSSWMRPSLFLRGAFVAAIGYAAAQAPLSGQVASELDVRYANDTVPLAASLLLPQGPGPHPAAVLVQGSGESSRSNSWSRQVAELLTAHGVAVLHTDKRGSGESGGDWTTSSFYDLAADASAGLAFLRSREEIDSERLGLVGLSQGGWVVPIVASREPVAFVINVSGTSVSFAEQIFHEMANTTRRAGLDEAAVAGVMGLNQSVWDYLDSGDWDAYSERRLDGLSTDWGSIAEGFPNDPDESIWSFLGQVYRFDPMSWWLGVTAPVYVVYGSEDEYDNVPVEESVRRFHFGFRLAGKQNYAILVVPGVGHGLRVPLDPYPLAPEFRGGVGRWLERILTEPAGGGT